MFKLRDDADEFFSRISKKLARQAPRFDMYYFCLVAGLGVKRRVPDLNRFDSRDLVDNFPGEYRQRADMLVGMLLASELERLEVDRSDKAIVHQTVGKLIEPRSMSSLSSDGIYALNAYSFAGCDVLRQDWFDEKPSSLEYFLLRFHEKSIEMIT
jgi:hypothetical protein